MVPHAGHVGKRRLGGAGFHANAEFYADFGAYDVAITLPAGYVTGGSGLLTGTVDHGDGTQTNTYHAVEIVVVHEIGHQWFQSMVATNEAREPWLDEGFTDYSTERAMAAAYGANTLAVKVGDLQAIYLDFRRLEYLANPGVPMYGAAWDFNRMADYDVVTYSKPVLGLLTLQNVLSEETCYTSYLPILTATSLAIPRPKISAWWPRKNLART